jgi:hypothetical protein
MLQLPNLTIPNGNSVALGSFDSCLDIKFKELFSGQHCLVELNYGGKYDFIMSSIPHFYSTLGEKMVSVDKEGDIAMVSYCTYA